MPVLRLWRYLGGCEWRANSVHGKSGRTNSRIDPVLGVLTSLLAVTCVACTPGGGGGGGSNYPAAVMPQITSVTATGVTLTQTQTSGYCNAFVFPNATKGTQYVIDFSNIPSPSNLEVAVDGLELGRISMSDPFGSAPAFKFDWSTNPNRVIVSPQADTAFVMWIRNVSWNTSLSGTARISNPVRSPIRAQGGLVPSSPYCPRYDSRAVPGGRIAFVSDRSGQREVWIMRGDETWGGLNLTKLSTVSSANPVIGEPESYNPPNFTFAFKSGIRVAYERGGDIWVSSAEGGAIGNLSAMAGADTEPVSGADGRFAWVNGGDIWGYVAGGASPALERVTNTSAIESSPNFSPDGTQLTYVRDGKIWTVNLATMSATSRTALNTPAVERSPVFSPDGSKIAFVRDDKLWIMNSSGGGEVNLGTGTTGTDEHPCFNVNGYIVFDSGPAAGPRQIFTVSSTGGQRTQLTTQGSNFSPTCSPYPSGPPPSLSLSSRIAFVSDRTGNREIFIMDAGGARQENMTNNAASDDDPHWR